MDTPFGCFLLFPALTRRVLRCSTSRTVICAEPELSLEGVEYEANHCRSSLYLHTRGGGYRPWTLTSSAPISGGGGKPIDKFANRPAAETGAGRLPCQRLTLQPAVHEAKSSKSMFRRTQRLIISHGQRRAAASSGPLGEFRHNLFNDGRLVTYDWGRCLNQAGGHIARQLVEQCVANGEQCNSNNSINNSVMHVGMVLRHGNTILMASRRHNRAAIAMRRKSGADDARRSCD